MMDVIWYGTKSNSGGWDLFPEQTPKYVYSIGWDLGTQSKDTGWEIEIEDYVGKVTAKIPGVKKENIEVKTVTESSGKYLTVSIKQKDEVYGDFDIDKKYVLNSEVEDIDVKNDAGLLFITINFKKPKSTKIPIK